MEVEVEHQPRLLSDNGPCKVASDLREWLEKYKIEQVSGAPGHPQTQGEIERQYQTLKNRVLLENYFFQEDLEAQIAAFVEHSDHRRYHESLDNLTHADVYCEPGATILPEREKIKRDTIKQCRLNLPQVLRPPVFQGAPRKTGGATSPILLRMIRRGCG